MADRAIRAAGGADAPLSYVVPGATAIRIKQLHVKYVDNGAAGDWLPAVRIVDDAGHTMGTAADQNVSVFFGDDADVSFFPGVKHAAAATVDTGRPFCYLSSTANTSIPGGSVFTPVNMEGGINATFVQNFLGPFDAAGTVIGGNTYQGIAILTAGIYRFSMVHFITGGTAGARIDTEFLAYGLPGSTTSPAQSFYKAGRNSVLFGDQWDPGVAPAVTFVTEYWDFPSTAVPSVMVVDATNHGVAAGSMSSHFWAEQVTTFNVPIADWN